MLGVKCYPLCKITGTAWWDHNILQNWDDQQWLQNFHTRKQTFLELYKELALTLQCHNI